MVSAVERWSSVNPQPILVSPVDSPGHSLGSGNSSLALDSDRA